MNAPGYGAAQREGFPRWTAPAAAALMVAMALAAATSAKLGSRFDGDSFLPAMISLQRLTVYYWGQNRFGNLLPWLVSGVHDAMLNFRLQVFFRALGTAATPLPVLLFLGVRKRLFAAYALSLGLMLLPFSAQGNFFIWVDIEPYGQSMLLLLGAMLAHGAMRGEKPAWWNAMCGAGAMLAATLAFFVNTSLVIFALPLWAGAAVMTGAKRDWGFAGMLAAAFALGSAPSRWFGSEYHMNYDYSHMAFAVKNFFRTGATIGSMGSGWILAACVAGALCGLWAIQRLKEPATEGPIRGLGRWGFFAGLDARVWRAALLLAVAAFYLALVANMGWVKENAFAFRYFMFPLLVPPVVCAGVAMEAATRRVQGAAGAMVALAAMAAVVLLKLAPFGGSDPYIEATHRADTAAVAELARENGASFITGDYYLVWPSVFYAIHLRQEAGDPGALQVYGLAPKGEILREVFADYLRNARRVVMIGAGADVQDCYQEALHNDLADWPVRASLLKTGKLPSGITYRVVAFYRDTAGEPPLQEAGAVPLPSRGMVMLHMVKTDPDVTRWEGDEDIKVAAVGSPRLVLKGAYWNFPPGKYRASFKIATKADTTQHTQLLLIDVVDRQRTYARRGVTADALEQRDGSAWASILFEVPAGARTQDADVRLWTSGISEFDILDMEISPAP